MIWTAIALVLAYLIGSISSSIILSKVAGFPDPRTQGSGNPGATNVLRIAGKKFALIALLGDMAKGVLAVLLGRILGQEGLLLGLVALAVFLGHLYPIFFKFKGGKGVATGFGAMITLSPILGLAALVTWGVIAFVFRYSSLSALVAFVLAPVYAAFLGLYGYIIPIAFMAGFVLLRHRANIKRLLAGTESKIGKTRV